MTTQSVRCCLAVQTALCSSPVADALPWLAWCYGQYAAFEDEQGIYMVLEYAEGVSNISWDNSVNSVAQRQTPGFRRGVRVTSMVGHEQHQSAYETRATGSRMKVCHEGNLSACRLLNYNLSVNPNPQLTGHLNGARLDTLYCWTMCCAGRPV